MEQDTQVTSEVPTYTAAIVIGSIAILALIELVFRGSE